MTVDKVTEEPVDPDEGVVLGSLTLGGEWPKNVKKIRTQREDHEDENEEVRVKPKKAKKPKKEVRGCAKCQLQSNPFNDFKQSLCTVKSRFSESRFNVKSQFKVQNVVTKFEFDIKKSRFTVMSRFKE